MTSIPQATKYLSQGKNSKSSPLGQKKESLISKHNLVAKLIFSKSIEYFSLKNNYLKSNGK